MLYMSNIIIENVMKNATADNIESSLECFSLLVEKLNEAKRKFDHEPQPQPIQEHVNHLKYINLLILMMKKMMIAAAIMFKIQILMMKIQMMNKYSRWCR